MLRNEQHEQNIKETAPTSKSIKREALSLYYNFYAISELCRGLNSPLDPNYIYLDRPFRSAPDNK